jgi:hypothetical protein
MVNGVASVLAVSLVATGTQAINIASSVAVSQTDRLGLRVTKDGAHAAITDVYVTMEWT